MMPCPDADETVLLCGPGDDSPWPGYLDIPHWRSADGLYLNPHRVTHWAKMPAGPRRRSPPRTTAPRLPEPPLTHSGWRLAPSTTAPTDAVATARELQAERAGMTPIEPGRSDPGGSTGSAYRAFVSGRFRGTGTGSCRAF